VAAIIRNFVPTMQSVREPTMADAPAPRLELIFAANVSVGPPLDCGDVGKGARRIVPITGGEFSGPNIRGKVLPGGADWQILRGDGVSELEARYTLQTDDGALINVRNLALRHGPPEVMAALAAGGAGDARYGWITKCIVVCSGEREPAGVKLKFYKVL
jgi:hypothetical protein